jgi:hypothetical protein
MTDAELWAAWRTWMIVAAVVVAVAAGLLVTIWLTARRIAAEAGRALRAAEAIDANTRAIWELQTTNEVAGRLLETVRAIESRSRALADALSGARPEARR